MLHGINRDGEASVRFSWLSSGQRPDCVLVSNGGVTATRNDDPEATSGTCESPPPGWSTGAVPVNQWRLGRRGRRSRHRRERPLCPND
jgi:hypothetical protein